MNLASYATKPEDSRGRMYPDFVNIIRSPFQRDRDRLIHSMSFRRLDGKTQVFAYHEGKNYRTRLTHSIEVAQITRTLCKSLDLNEELGEAIALAHDLGHSPFGHAGERGLSKVMKPYGGFDHNIQALRIITEYESHYPNFPGLNLMLLLSSAARIHSLVEPIESRHSDFFPEIASSPETNFKAIPFPTNFVNFEVSPSKSSSNITFSLPTSLTGAAAAEFFGVFSTAFNFESSRDFALPLQ